MSINNGDDINISQFSSFSGQSFSQPYINTGFQGFQQGLTNPSNNFANAPASSATNSYQGFQNVQPNPGLYQSLNATAQFGQRDNQPQFQYGSYQTQPSLSNNQDFVKTSLQQSAAFPQILQVVTPQDHASSASARNQDLSSSRPITPLTLPSVNTNATQIASPPRAGSSSSSRNASNVSPASSSMPPPPLPTTSHRQASQPQSPTISTNSARESERTALLLDINLALLEEMNRLQGLGQGGAVNQNQIAMMKSQGLPEKFASEDYQQIHARIQSNLAYLFGQPDAQPLSPLSQAGRKPSFIPPQYMHAPPNFHSIAPKYARLRNLFPGWLGRDAPANVSV